MSHATDFFTTPQPILPRMNGSNYIPRLEHAVLVVMTSTHALMHSRTLHLHVYDEPTRIEARHRLELFFSTVHKMAERGDFADASAARRFVDNTLYAIVAKIRGMLFDLRYDDSEGQQMGADLSKILRALISQQLETIADETGYGLLALSWHLAYGDMSNNTSMSRSSRSALAHAIHSHSTNDRDEVEELLDANGFHSCSDCDDWTHEDYLLTPYNCDDDQVCNSCIDSNYRYSEHYGAYVYTDSGRWALDSEGGEVFIHEDDGNFNWEPQLLGTYHSRSRVGKQPFIHSVWTRQNDRFMGVELEVEVKDGSIDSHVEALNVRLNDGEVGKRVYFEADGSLTHGFEIISNPMGLDSHYKLWSALADRDLVRGMRSHDTSTCGLHVHVSRRNMHTMQINKMNVFLNHPDNQDLIKAVARRYDVNYARIAQKKLSNAHKYDVERRDALNITNDNTVEFRIFKGTLIHDTLLSAIEFANAVVNFTMPASTAGFHLSTQRFIDFIDSPSQRSETKHLRNHLKAQNIMS